MAKESRSTNRVRHGNGSKTSQFFWTSMCPELWDALFVGIYHILLGDLGENVHLRNSTNKAHGFLSADVIQVLQRCFTGARANIRLSLSQCNNPEKCGYIDYRIQDSGFLLTAYRPQARTSEYIKQTFIQKYSIIGTSITHKHNMAQQ